MSVELAGVVPITVTPFDEAGRVDEPSIATLVEFERAAASTCPFHLVDPGTLDRLPLVVGL